jgi:hypothetical protein
MMATSSSYPTSIRLRFQQLKYDVHHADVATDPRRNETSSPTLDQRDCEGERRLLARLEQISPTQTAFFRAI